MASVSGLVKGVTTFVSGGAAAVAVYAFTQYYKSTASAPKASTVNSAIPWSDKTKHTKQPTPFATGDTIFAFGTGSRYFFAHRRNADNAFSWSSSYPLSCKTAADLKARASKLYFVSITPHDDELIASEDVQSCAPSWTFCVNPDRYAQAPSYDSLLRWLKDNVAVSDSSLMKTSIVFGPGAACFARTADSCFRQDLPTFLENMLVEKQRSYSSNEDEETAKTAWIPRIVALGQGQSFIAIWDDGQWATHLSDDNPIAKQFKKGDLGIPIECWENIVLSPHQADHYYAATKLGHIYWHNFVSIRDQPYIYMQMRAKEQNMTYRLSWTPNGGDEVAIAVSPDSDWTKDKLQAALGPNSVQSWYTNPVGRARQLWNKWL